MMEDSARGRGGHDGHVLEMVLTDSNMGDAQGMGKISSACLSVSDIVEKKCIRT